MAWNRPLIIGFLVVVLAITWWRLQPVEEEVRRSRLLMGTVVEIVAEGLQPDRLEAAIHDAFSEIGRLDKLLSKYQEASDVSNLSQSETDLDVSTETAEVIALGLDLAKQSNGAFDMTLGRLKSLWGFDRDKQIIPDPQALEEALAGIGPEALTLHDQRVEKRTPQLQLDLGGIAKGYAVDRAVSVLKQHGVSSAAINAGGDMYLLGQRPERSWRIGIQHPRQQGQVLETVQIKDRAVVTSGDYERFFEQDGVRYHHIFDPKSGHPARKCQSVTIITDSVALGDALATAVFVLGPDAGLKLLSRYPSAEGLIIAADSTRHSSPGWTDYKVAQ